MPPSVHAFKGHTLLRWLFMDATQDLGIIRNSAEIQVWEVLRCVVKLGELTHLSEKKAFVGQSNLQEKSLTLAHLMGWVHGLTCAS